MVVKATGTCCWQRKVRKRPRSRSPAASRKGFGHTPGRWRRTMACQVGKSSWGLVKAVHGRTCMTHTSRRAGWGGPLHPTHTDIHALDPGPWLGVLPRERARGPAGGESGPPQHPPRYIGGGDENGPPQHLPRKGGGESIPLSIRPERGGGESGPPHSICPERGVARAVPLSIRPEKGGGRERSPSASAQKGGGGES